MLHYIHKNYAIRLRTLEQKYLSRDTLHGLAQNSKECGSPYPNIIGFIDATCRKICRPSRNQRNYYSGYKKSHVIKYQSVMMTNGLIGRLDGPIIGRRHDAAILHLSKILDEMQRFLTNDDCSYFAVYGDPGYSNQTFIKVGYKNYLQLNAKQKEFNSLMSSMRVSVEYGFGNIINEFAFLDFSKSQKVHLNSLKEAYYVGAFLVNCQACIRGRNQVSDIFSSYVPTLSEYLMMQDARF